MTRSPAEAVRGASGLLLDVDDTIVDTRAAMVEAGARAAAAVWPGPADHHRALAQRYYDDPERWFPRYASGDVPFETMRAGRLAEVATAFDLDLPRTALSTFEEAYAPAFREAQRLFPDVPGLLAAAEAAGLVVALLTNSALAPTTVKLEALGLTERFEVVVTTDTLGFGKPDARVYLEACRLMELEPAEVVCVGDSLEWDVLGARAAGLRAVWLDRGGQGTSEPVPVVTHLGELGAVLEPRFGPAPDAR